jgi:hypothetical protein
MDKQTVRGVYDNGELRFTEPVHHEGFWQVEITFVDRLDAPVEADPHRLEQRPVPDRIDELQRHVDDQRLHTGI